MRKLQKKFKQNVKMNIWTIPCQQYKKNKANNSWASIQAKMWFISTPFKIYTEVYYYRSI